MTRDRGAEVLVETTVPSGVTAMQALRTEADVDTGYGGRFVDSIEGVAGDADEQRDWFYFVNGIEADRGAAEYRLRPGECSGGTTAPGRARTCASPWSWASIPSRSSTATTGRRGERSFASRRKRCEARRSASRMYRSGQRKHVDVPIAPDANALIVTDDAAALTSELRPPDGAAGSPVVFQVDFEDAKRLLKDPTWRSTATRGSGRGAGPGPRVAGRARRAALVADHWLVPAVTAAVLLGLSSGRRPRGAGRTSSVAGSPP